MPIDLIIDRDKGQKPNERTRIECICSLPWPAGPDAEDGGEIWLSVYVTNENDLQAVTDRLKPKFPVIDQHNFQATHKYMHNDSAAYTQPAESTYLHNYAGEMANPPNHHKHYMLSDKLEVDEEDLFNQAKALLAPLIIR